MKFVVEMKEESLVGKYIPSEGETQGEREGAHSPPTHLPHISQTNRGLKENQHFYYMT